MREMTAKLLASLIDVSYTGETKGEQEDSNDFIMFLKNYKVGEQELTKNTLMDKTQDL